MIINQDSCSVLVIPIIVEYAEDLAVSYRKKRQT